MVLGALQGWPSGLGCWDGWRHGWSAWAVVSSGAGGGRRSYAVIFCALPLSSPLSPSLPLQIVGSLGAGGGAGSGVWLGLALHGRRRSRFPGLGRAGASCWPCILSASAGCWLCLASSGAGSLLVPAGLCWALNAWGLLGAGSGSAWASLAPGSPPWCRAGGCPCRAGGGGWAGCRAGGGRGGWRIPFVKLHRSSLAGLVIIQGKSDKF